jgi:hypothetical protein
LWYFYTPTNIRVNDTRTAPISNSNCHITSTSCLLNHRCSFQISRAYYITAGKRGFLDVTVKGNEHRFKSLYKWESVKHRSLVSPAEVQPTSMLNLTLSLWYKEDCKNTMYPFAPFLDLVLGCMILLHQSVDGS